MLRVVLLLIFVSAGREGWGQANPIGERPSNKPTEEPKEESEENDFHSLYYSAHLPTDRSLSQNLEQARKLLVDGRFSEGLLLVDRVIAAEKDTFGISGVLRSDDLVSGSTRGLKLAAKELLAALPPAGVAALELEWGVTARRRLNQATRAGDLDAIAGVASRYPLTEAAGDALWMVAQSKIDSGDHGSAAAIFDRLRDWPSTSQKQGLSLGFREAICWANEGDRAKLEVALERLAGQKSSKQRSGLRKLLGQRSYAEWEAQLRERASAGTESAPVRPVNWLIEGGDLDRNPQGVGGIPHVWPAWHARTAKQAIEASRWKRREHWSQERGGGWTLTASPLAIGDLVVARTPHNLVAFDWHSGKRVWETRSDRTTVPESPFHIAEQQGAEQQGSEPMMILLDSSEQRMWLDTVFGAISSDGERVYALRDLGNLSAHSMSPWRVGALGIGRTAPEVSFGNGLAAFDLHSEGKMVWQIHGAVDQGDEAGIFFLAPPLAVEGQLYAIAELRNSIHLVAIRAQDGQILWKQPLANLERNLQLDVGRRLAGVSPSYGQGLLVCPTGAGSVVAIDPIDHSLQWAYRFEVEESVASRSSTRWNRRWSAYQPSLTGAWSRNRCLLASGRVVVTAPESDELHCIDLATGQKIWTKARGDGRFVAGIAHGKVLVVAADHLLAYDLATGTKSWRLAFPEGATAAGLGVLTDDQLLLPFSGGRLGVFDIPAAELSATLTIREDQLLGNLAYHRGTLLSQSTSSLTRFDPIGPLQELASGGFEQSPPSPQSLRIQGEIAWGEGDLEQAIDSFRQAYEAAPDDSLIRWRFTHSLLAGLKADYPHYCDRSDLLPPLVEGQPEQRTWLRLHLDGLLQMEDLPAAFAVALQLYSVDREEWVTWSPGHEVQSERWFAGRVLRLWNRADDALRQTMTDEVDHLFQAAQANAGRDSVSRLVRYFGTVPAGRRARMARGIQLVRSGQLAEAELLLLYTDPNQREAEVRLLTPEHRELFSRLSGSGATPWRTPSSLSEANERSFAHPIAFFSDWPDGKVEVERARVAGARVAALSTRSRSQGPQQSPLHPVAVGFPWAGPSRLAIAEGGGELMGWNELGEVSQRTELHIDSLKNTEDTSEVRSIRFGHFCAIGRGDEVALLDLRTHTTAENKNYRRPLLWATQSDGLSSPSLNRFGGIPMQIRGGQFLGRALLRGNLSDNALRKDAKTGQLCAAVPLGVVLRDGDTVRCFGAVDGALLWQRSKMPSDGEAFGDWRHLFLLSSGSQEGVVLSMVDGTTVGTWGRPKGNWKAMVAGHLVTTWHQNNTLRLEVVDAFSGKRLVQRRYAEGTCLTQVDAQTFVVVERSGSVEMIDAEQGVVRFTRSLLPEPDLASLHALRSGTTLFLATNTWSQAQHTTVGNLAIADAPVVTGHVYALDTETGEPRWDHPATVKGQGLAMTQPPATPALIFLSELEDRPPGRSGKTTRLLCLDKRTGRSLAREEKILPLNAKPYALRVDHGRQPTVTIDLRHTTLSLRFTDTPRPPEPVATADVEGTKKSVRAGLFGLMQKAFGSGIEIKIAPVDEE